MRLMKFSSQKNAHPRFSRRLRTMIGACLMVVMTLALPLQSVEAASNVTNSYNYDYFRYEQGAPDAYEPRQILRGETLGIGAFNAPTDVFVSTDKHIFIADSGNHRIVELDQKLALVKVFDTFDQEGKEDKFNTPQGVYVDDDGDLYVADTENGRIVQLDRSGGFKRQFDAPRSELIPEDYVYRPTKIVLDRAKRIYVIARNVNQGIIELDMDGNFQSFMGAIPVQVNPWDYIWKRFSTAAQRAQMVQFVPTEYNNIAIDSDGFLFVTSGTQSETTNQPIRKLNLTGQDIMRRTGEAPIVGDLNVMWTGDAPQGPSIFVDITANDEAKTFSGLDRKRGRIFTYDENGNLLHITGNLSDQAGNFRAPSSIASFGKDLVIADSQLNSVTFMSLTAYGDSIHQALISHNKGEYEKAEKLWQTVLRNNANAEIAYYGLGRTQMRVDDFQGAMESFRLANHRSAYSDAYQLALKDIVREHVVLVILGIAAVAALIYLFAKYKNKLFRKDIPVLDGFNYAFYLIFHPFDGFYDIKHENRGNALSATVIYALVGILQIVRRQLTGFIFNRYDPLQLNVLAVLASTLLPYFVWIVANWCLTTLMDGKGTMKEIYTATGYALFPQILIGFPLIALSHIMSGQQAPMFTFMLSVAMIWSYALIFIGAMITHDYSLGKNIAVTIFTFVGMGLILFIGMLVFDLGGQMVNFVQAIAKEIQFRM